VIFVVRRLLGIEGGVISVVLSPVSPGVSSTGVSSTGVVWPGNGNGNESVDSPEHAVNENIIIKADITCFCE
jgi:hypothetical protein